jgi:hypothetical protein
MNRSRKLTALSACNDKTALGSSGNGRIAYAEYANLVLAFDGFAENARVVLAEAPHPWPRQAQAMHWRAGHRANVGHDGGGSVGGSSTLHRCTPSQQVTAHSAAAGAYMNSRRPRCPRSPNSR